MRHTSDEPMKGFRESQNLVRQFPSILLAGALATLPVLLSFSYLVVHSGRGALNGILRP